MTSHDYVLVGLAFLASSLVVGYMCSQPRPRQSDIRNAIERGLRNQQSQQYVEAIAELEHALKLLRASGSADLGQEVSCLIHLGNCYERMGQPDKAGDVFKQAIANWQRQLQQNKLNPIDIDYAVTNLDFGRGTLEVAEFYVDNIIAGRERTYTRGHPDLENSYKIGANLLRRSGYKKEAELLEQRGREGPPGEI